MTSELLARVLRVLNRRRPFRPYWIEFTSGDRVLVSHPEIVHQSGDLFLYSAPDRSSRAFHPLGVCQIIDPPPTPPPA